MTPLLPQQRLMVDHIKVHPRCALFADPGLGKTRAVIEAVSDLMAEGATSGVLIIAPLRVAVLTWPNEVAKWAPWMKVADLRTAEGRRAWDEGSAHLYVVNYEMLPRLAVKKPGAWPVDMAVFDEVHNAKNPSSTRVRAFLKHRDKFTRIVGMTGTPIANSHMDLFAPMRLIDGGERLGKVMTHFRSRYFESDYMGWKWSIRPWAREAIAKKISDITLTLKAADYLDIPPVTVTDVDVPLSRDDMRRYRQLEADCLLRIDKDKEIVGVNAAALIGKLTQFTSGASYDENGEELWLHNAKIEALRKIMSNTSEPVLVATMYRHERRRILQTFVHAEEWNEGSLARWNRRDIRMLVVDPRSVGAGLNLQDGGRTLVWFTNTYSRLLYDQMNARLARTGQEQETLVYRLLCPSTVDWAIAEALRVKGEEQDGLKSTLKNLRRLL